VKGKRLLALLGSVCLMLVLASLPFMGACAKPAPSPAPSPAPAPAPAAPKSIVIGIEIGLTGGDASIGQPAKNGYDLAVEDINKDGGVFVKEFGKKIPLELAYVDTETDPEKAVARAEALNSQYKATVACGTTMISATSDIWEKNKLPCITTLMSINGLMERGFKYWFAMGDLNSDKVKAILNPFDNLPKDVRPTKWAVFEEQTDWVAEFFVLAKKEAAARGLNLVYEGKYAMMSPDLSPLIRGAKDAGAEAILSCPTPPDAITMLKQMKELGYNPKGIIMTRGADDPLWAQILGPMGEYVVGAPDWHHAINFPGVKELDAKYKAKFGTDAHPAAGPAYASIQVVAAAIEKAGTLDRSKIRDAIAATDMMTVIGPVKFRDNGAIIDPPLVAIQWQKGVMELIGPDNLKTKSLVYPIPR